jgi:tellurite resistance protein TehA-like permease
MGTGISSVLIHKYPFEFRGQQTIALVIFGLVSRFVCPRLSLS